MTGNACSPEIGCHKFCIIPQPTVPLVEMACDWVYMYLGEGVDENCWIMVSPSMEDAGIHTTQSVHLRNISGYPRMEYLGIPHFRPPCPATECYEVAMAAAMGSHSSTVEFTTEGRGSIEDHWRERVFKKTRFDSVWLDGWFDVEWCFERWGCILSTSKY